MSLGEADVGDARQFFCFRRIVVAYLINFAALPPPSDGMTWQLVDSFNAGDELLREPGLKKVVKAAIDQAGAVRRPPGPFWKLGTDWEAAP